MSKVKYVVGIDPDIDKNGVAVVQPEDRDVQLYSWTLSETIAQLKVMPREETMIVIEAGWLNKSNYHLSQYDTKHSAARKGVDQGRNHQRGIDLVELLCHQGFKVVEMKPLTLMWGEGLKRKKISDKELRSFMDIHNKKRTNQEERDAALLAWVYAGLPMNIGKVE